MRYINQDLFEFLETVPESRDIYIPHVVNNFGGWGSGFVIPLGQRFPEAKQDYIEWYKSRNRFFLGNNHISWDVDKNKNIKVVHMLAQNGFANAQNPVPLVYDALQGCMQRLEDILMDRYEDGWNTTVICPKFGCGLAGGDWGIVESYIKEYWDDNTEVIVCEV